MIVNLSSDSMIEKNSFGRRGRNFDNPVHHQISLVSSVQIEKEPFGRKGAFHFD